MHLSSSFSPFRDVLTNNVSFVRPVLDSSLLMYESGQKTKDNTKEKKRKGKKKKRPEPTGKPEDDGSFWGVCSGGKQETVRTKDWKRNWKELVWEKGIFKGDLLASKNALYPFKTSASTAFFETYFTKYCFWIILSCWTFFFFSVTLCSTSRKVVGLHRLPEFFHLSKHAICAIWSRRIIPNPLMIPWCCYELRMDVLGALPNFPKTNISLKLFSF